MLVLEGHEGTVTALAYAPDGRTLATGGSDGRVRLWDPFAGSLLRQCSLSGMVSSLASDAGGKWVAAGHHGTVSVWSVASGRLLHEHRQISERAYRGEATFVAFHPREERLAVAHSRNAVVEVTPLSDRRLETFPSPLQNPNWASPAASPWYSLCYVGEALAAGLVDHVALWRSAEQGHRSSVHWPNGPFVCVASDAAGRWLAAGRARGVALWDLSLPNGTAKRARTFKLGDAVNAVALTPDGRTLLAGGDDWTVHVWDVASGQKRNEYNWRLGQVTALAVSPDGMTCAVTGRKGPQVLIWDLE